RWLRRKRKPRLRRPRLRRRRSSPLRTWPRSFRKPGRRRSPPTRFGYISGAWSDSRTAAIPGISSKRVRSFSTRSGKVFGRSTSPSRRRRPRRRRPANRERGFGPSLLLRASATELGGEGRFPFSPSGAVGTALSGKGVNRKVDQIGNFLEEKFGKGGDHHRPSNGKGAGLHLQAPGDLRSRRKDRCKRSGGDRSFYPREAETPKDRRSNYPRPDHRDTSRSAF